MRRSLLVLICLVVSASFVAGCGDDNAATKYDNNSSSGQSATPATSDSATDSAKATLDACLSSAEKLPADKVEGTKERCQEAYDNIKDANAKIDEKTKEAAEKCKEAANKIPDGDAKANALAACDRFQ